MALQKLVIFIVICRQKHSSKKSISLIDGDAKQEFIQKQKQGQKLIEEETAEAGIVSFMKSNIIKKF